MRKLLFTLCATFLSISQIQMASIHIDDFRLKPTTNEEENIKDEIRKQISEFALNYLNTPYLWGSNGPKSFDCSGYVNYVYEKTVGIDLPRVSSNIAKYGTKVDKDDLQLGDILYFKTTRKNRISHVGIYIGDNKFVHASSRNKKVVISEIKGYYQRTLRGAVRPVK
ncbi:C40 family peptidase [Caviibacter abscessus]|uniref:C40 family peptidase n=1 Tax=Caviibacter abscessus TaxID=1766719 RepID=UPI0008301F84|nr:C40 family peptidase [Caviibacter abscessus]